MCGRAYETYTDEELYFRYLSKQPVTPLALLPVYNLCPTQNSPVLRLVTGQRQFDQMRWQLVPATEPAFTTRLSTINARSETIFQSRPIVISSSAGGASSRCLVCRMQHTAYYAGPENMPNQPRAQFAKP